MQIDNQVLEFELNEVEIETVRRAALARSMEFDPAKRRYSALELDSFGIVREAYNEDELKAFGVDRNRIVTSFDQLTAAAQQNLRVDAPFGTSCKKWQLPIDVHEGRTFITEFEKGSFVEPHVHPENNQHNPGGSLRTVLTGGVKFQGKNFGPGDWFYIPNGVPYTFKVSDEETTRVLYTYAFFGVSDGNRFSAPEDLGHKNSLKAVA